MNISNTTTTSTLTTTSTSYFNENNGQATSNLLNTITTSNSSNTTIASSHTYTVFSEFSKETTLFYYVAFSVMFVVGSVGNSLVIYVIAAKGHLKTNFDIYIVSLAIADLLASIFLPVVMIHDLYTAFYHWHLAGNLGCKLLVPMPHINSLVSALMLVVISFDRLRYFLVRIIFMQRITSIKLIQENFFLSLSP